MLTQFKILSNDIINKKLSYCKQTVHQQQWQDGRPVRKNALKIFPTAETTLKVTQDYWK